MKEINLVYFSATGTTALVATTLAKGLSPQVNKFDLLRQPPTAPVVMQPDTPVIFAMPVYAGRIPALCVQWLRQFRGQNTPAIAVVVYGNREYDDALLELCDLVKENGFVVAAAAAFVAQHSIFPDVAAGRPDEKDKQAIADFAKTCAAALDCVTGDEPLKIKGNTPYCKPGAVTLHPSGDAKCNSCGACVKICPTKSILPETPRETDEARCISCAACIAACPQNARGFYGPVYSAASKAFTQKNAARKEPEVFAPSRQI